MKKIFKWSFAVVLGSIGLTSCLKDDILLDPDKTTNVIELVNTSVPISPITSEIIAFSNSFVASAESPLDIVVRYTGAHTAPEDITVNLTVDPSLITAYNTQNNRTYIALPSNLYTIPSLSVTIPKGGKEVVVPVKLKTNEFDFSKAYAIPLKIESVSSGIISGNYGRALFAVGAKNQYDGEYTHTYVSTLGNGTNTVSMATIDANSVRLVPGLLGVYSNAVTLTIDPATNRVTVAMTTLLPIATDPSSKYDPATKTFTLKWTSNGGARTFEETFKRK